MRGDPAQGEEGEVLGLCIKRDAEEQAPERRDAPALREAAGALPRGLGGARAAEGARELPGDRRGVAAGAPAAGVEGFDRGCDAASEGELLFEGRVTDKGVGERCGGGLERYAGRAGRVGRAGARSASK